MVSYIKGRTGYTLRVFENKVLRKILETKKKLTEGWRDLHSHAPHDLYSLQILLG
jgi:hypothetical protein